MTKAENIADPNSCWNKAADDEPVFVLRAKDPAFQEAVIAWMEKRIKLGLNVRGDEKMADASVAAVNSLTYRRVKYPKSI